MALPQAAVATPDRIAGIGVSLYSPDPTGSETAGAQYSVQVVYDTGEVRVLTGDLVPHLTQQQITGLLSFMDAMRVQANTQILP